MRIFLSSNHGRSGDPGLKFMIEIENEIKLMTEFETKQRFSY